MHVVEGDSGQLSVDVHGDEVDGTGSKRANGLAVDDVEVHGRRLVEVLVQVLVLGDVS